VLHIATHGFFFADPKKDHHNHSSTESDKQVFRSSDNPLNRAGLLFAGSNLAWGGAKLTADAEDGILTAYEATNVSLTKTQLVVLSACETGLGEIKGSEGVFGLQRAFKSAGTEYLMMSLWKVPDKETAEFMTYFYSNWFNGNNIPSAFYQTQQYMKTQYRNDPYKWAAFVLVR
jgi:CHAT domain-containing protein